MILAIVAVFTLLHYPCVALETSSVDVINFFADAHTTPGAQNTLRPSDLQKLRWIEGTWRGTGIKDQPPFFERYRFESDTVLAVDGFEDEKLTKVTLYDPFRVERWRVWRRRQRLALCRYRDR